MNYPKQVNHITTRELNDESIIIDLNEKRMFHQLNSVGSFIWKHCQGHLSKEQIITKLTEEFKVDHPTATQDVEAFLDQLESNSLISSNEN